MSDWHTIFSERGAIIAILGGLGGMVRSLALKTTWREGVRVVVIGSATAFGFGTWSPRILAPWVSGLPDGAYASGAFLVGLLSVAIVERIAAGINPPSEDRDERP